MKKTYLWIAVPVIIIIGFFILKGLFGIKKSKSLSIIYPFNLTVFPKDMAAPAFAWKDDNPKVKKWQIMVKTGESTIIDELEVPKNFWKPSREEWNFLLTSGTEKKHTVTIHSEANGMFSDASVTFSISDDSVDAAIFFRSVPLPFKFARENMKKIKWYLGDVSSDSKPHAMLQDMPVCANCHSFSKDGKTIGMDVDAIDDKGAYVILSLIHI